MISTILILQVIITVANDIISLKRLATFVKVRVRPRAIEDTAARGQDSFTGGPQETIRKASRKLSNPVMIFTNALATTSLPVAVSTGFRACKDHDLRANVANEMVRHNDEYFLGHVVFSDESTFHLVDTSILIIRGFGAQEILT